MARKSYGIRGLTCADCLARLMERVRKVSGVRSVGVHLVRGGTSRLVLVASKVPDLQAVRAAVEDAGFLLVLSSAPPLRSGEV